MLKSFIIFLLWKFPCRYASRMSFVSFFDVVTVVVCFCIQIEGKRKDRQREREDKESEKLNIQLRCTECSIEWSVE